MATILVVEDEPSVLDSIGWVLRSEGHEVELIADCRVALETIQSRTFDLIISDIRIGPVDGLALLKESKQSHPDTPFMLISAYATEALLKEANELGVDQFLAKAFHIEDIIRAVNGLLPTVS